MDLGRLASPKQEDQKGIKMEPEMYSEVPPKWSPSGPPKVQKTIANPCVSAQNGAPKGPVFSPKMGPEMSRN